MGDDSDQPTHTMHDEVVADNEADDAVDKAVDNAMDNAVDNAVDSAVDNAVDNAMDEMPINVSPPANPIVPLLSFEQQSADSAATAIAGKWQSQRYPSLCNMAYSTMYTALTMLTVIVIYTLLQDALTVC